MSEDSQQKPFAPTGAPQAIGSAGREWVQALFPLALALLLVAATLWSAGLFGFTIYEDYLKVPGEVVVPDIKGKDIKDAYASTEQRGLQLQVHESRYDKKVPRRVVLSQNPPAGRKVREGRTILVVVSLGPELMDVPNVVGGTLRSAQIALSNSKLKVGKVTFENAAYGEDESVTVQNPSAGKQVLRGQEVHLTVRRAWR